MISFKTDFKLNSFSLFLTILHTNFVSTFISKIFTVIAEAMCYVRNR